MTRAALLRPMHLLVLFVGMTFFALTLAWWILPLTLVTYAALVFLAVRDPLFRGRVLGRRPNLPRARLDSPKVAEVSPEQRASRLPDGETRRTVEAALESCRRAEFTIETSGDDTRDLLRDAPLQLRRISEHLVDIAERRERVSGDPAKNNPDAPRHEDRNPGGPTGPEGGLRAEPHTVDAQISTASGELSNLRSRVVRISIEGGDAAREAANKLIADLDGILLRLDALLPESSPTEPPKQ